MHEYEQTEYKNEERAGQCLLERSLRTEREVAVIQFSTWLHFTRDQRASTHWRIQPNVLGGAKIIQRAPVRNRGAPITTN